MPVETPRRHSDPLLTTAEAAELLRMTERGVADWRYRGVGPRHIRLTNRAVRYRLSDVETWLETRERTSTSDEGRAA